MSTIGYSNPLEAADAAFKAGDFPAAVQLYRDTLQGQPALAVAWRGLGISLLQTGEVDEAVEACAKGAALQPTNADIRYAYGYSLGAQKKYGEAIRELDAALGLQANHGPARQLLIYALVQHGQGLADDDPRLAETYLERAFKIDHKNPNAVAPYLEHLRKTDQKGKAANVVNQLANDLRNDPSVQPILQKMHADSAFHTVLQQAAMSMDNVQNVAKPQPPQQQSSINYVPCPNCKQQIADYAAICPHCNFQNRAVGTFAGRDTGPNYEWQEIAFTIVSILWIANAGWSIYEATQSDEWIRDYVLTLSIANAAIGLGMLFKMDLAMTIAKYLCYITLLFSSYGVIFGLMLGRWVMFGSNLFELALAGFLVYLINYNSDV